MGRMTIQLTKTEISKLERKGRIVSCELWRCVVCRTAIHDRPGKSGQRGRERCHNGCRLQPERGIECRLCGDPIPKTAQTRLYCDKHNFNRGKGDVPDGIYTMKVANLHWHAADGTGPVSQYAIP